MHSAKPNESMKLMLVGLQKKGKTTLLSRLREINESNTPPTQHFTQRVGDAPMAASLRASSGKKSKGGEWEGEEVNMLMFDSSYQSLSLSHNHTHTHTHIQSCSQQWVLT